ARLRKGSNKTDSLRGCWATLIVPVVSPWAGANGVSFGLISLFFPLPTTLLAGCAPTELVLELGRALGTGRGSRLAVEWHNQHHQHKQHNPCYRLRHHRGVELWGHE